MVVVHELLQGRLSRVGGSLMILTERLGGTSMAMMGLAGAMGVAAMAAIHLVEWLGKVHEAKLSAEAGGIGSGISQDQIDRTVMGMRTLSGVTTEEAGKIAHAYLSMHGITKPVLDELAADTRDLALRMGVDNVQAAARVAEAWSLDAKAGAELLDKTRASAQTIQAFTAAATNNQAIEARSILLKELARNTTEVTNQTMLGDEAMNLARARANAARLTGNPAGPAATGLAQSANIDTQAATRADRLASALANVSAEQNKSADVTSWTQQHDAALQEILTKVATTATSSTQLHKAELTAEISFWHDAANEAGLSEKEKTEAQARESKARIQLAESELRGNAAAAKEGVKEHIAALNEQQAANKDDFAKVMELENQKISLLTAAGKAYTTELDNELKHRDELIRQHDEQQFQQAEQGYAADVQAQKSSLAEKTAVWDEEVAAHKLTKQQELNDTIKAVNDAYQADLQALNNFETTWSKYPTIVQKVQDQIKDLTAKHNADIASLNDKSLKEQEQQWNSYLSPITSAFDQSITGMIQGTQTLAQASARAAQSILMSFVRMAAQRLESWVVSELAQVTATQAAETAKTTATTVGATARTAADTAGSAASIASVVGDAIKWIMTEAAKVFASVFAFLAPTMGPGAAAPAAASMVAVEAVASLASGAPGMATGSFDVPQDMLANLHAGEMVVPATFAEGIRNATSGRGGGGTPVGMTVNINAIDTQSGAAFLRQQLPALASSLSRYMNMNPAARPSY
jgi:hypothetical protein